jgi:hypothetical protein
LASPETVTGARRRAVDRALQRMLGAEVATRDDVAQALALARVATEGCSAPGRPLYAGHASLDWPDQPHVALWHAIALLREFRGDGHIAALVTHGIGALTALVLHAASGEVPVAILRSTRAWPEDQWEAETARLQDEGWLDAAGTLTETGKGIRQSVEDTTDEAALAPWEHLGDESCSTLRELGKVLSREVLASGALPGRPR